MAVKANGIKAIMIEVGQLPVDNMATIKESYIALAIEPDPTRYGWVRVKDELSGSRVPRQSVRKAFWE